MKRLLILLAALGFYNCGSPTEVEPQNPNITVENDSITIDGKTKHVSSLDSNDLKEIKSSKDEELKNKIDSLVTADSLNNIKDTLSVSEKPLNNQLDSLFSNYLQTSVIDTNLVHQILDSLDVKELDSAGVEDLIDIIVKGSSGYVFDSITTSISVIPQTLQLNKETIKTILGKDIDVPEDFVYELPVLISLDYKNPIIYVPVGNDTEYEDGKVITLEGKEQKDNELDQNGFKLFLVE